MTTKMLQKLPAGPRLALFARRLRDWLIEDSGDPAGSFTESRARALLRATELLDDPTRHAFDRLVSSPDAARLALFDLLAESDLADNDEVVALGAASGAAEEPADPPEVEWLSLSMAAFAYQRGYPLRQLDPSAPPAQHTPAGQVVQRTAQLLRKQVQRSATERDRLLKTLNAPHTDQIDESAVPSLNSLDAGSKMEAILPFYRPPIPVRYPEMARETVELDNEDIDETPTAPQRGEPITIDESDLEDVDEALPPMLQPSIRIDDVPPERQPPISITPDQVTPQPPPSPLPRSGVIMPDASRQTSADAGSSFFDALRQRFSGPENMKATRLVVDVRQSPDGPPLVGVQVRVTCRGIRSHVAGVTDEEGEFRAELPVPVDQGLTYNVTVTWPREYGGESERKSITLHADRTRFELPFYRKQHLG